MARKSKYGQPSAKLSTTLWAPALYIRLSREDGDREESNSIASQRELLTEFVDTQTDMAAPRLYTDDGCTGTDFDRPDFQRMLNDLRAGIINCVIVKDLSRSAETMSRRRISRAHFSVAERALHLGQRQRGQLPRPTLGEQSRRTVQEHPQR
nr:recombinase family protein [Butyricicoccus sp. AF10-3]